MNSKIKTTLIIVITLASSLLGVKGYNYLPEFGTDSALVEEIATLEKQLQTAVQEGQLEIDKLDYNLQAWEQYSNRIDEKNIELCIEVNKLNGKINILENDLGVWTDKAVELQKQIVELEPNEPTVVIPAPTPTLQQTIQNTIGSVVHIMNETQGWQGSGVAISEDTILTARHINEAGDDFLITVNDGRTVSAHRAISHNKYDIGYIQIDKVADPNGKPYLIPAELASSKSLELAQPLYVIGSPFGKINFNSVTLGVVSGIKRNYDELNTNDYGEYDDYGWSIAFTTDAAGHPGNSGCPIFTYDGKVRGILVGGFSEVLIIAMPVDLILEDIEEVKSMFIQSKYHIEKVPDNRLEESVYRLDILGNAFMSLLESVEDLEEKINENDIKVKEVYDWYLNVSQVQ